jgi:hypothetical protein
LTVLYQVSSKAVLLYDIETWVLTKREENQLLVFDKTVLRTICGPKIENGVYKRRYNHELDREFDSPNVLNVTKTSRLRYAGHMTKSSIHIENGVYMRRYNHELDKELTVTCGDVELCFHLFRITDIVWFLFF